MRKSKIFVCCCVIFLASSGMLTNQAQQPQYGVTSTNPLANNSTTPVVAPPAAPQIRWRSNLSEARAEAKQTGKPILLHFYTDDCVYCEKLEKGAYRDPIVLAELEAKCIPVKVFAPDNADATKMLKVDRFPTDVIVTATGVVLMRSVSPLDPYAYISMLTSASDEHQKLAAAQPSGTQPQGSQTPGLPDRQAAVQQGYGPQNFAPQYYGSQPVEGQPNFQPPNGDALIDQQPYASQLGTPAPVSQQDNTWSNYRNEVSASTPPNFNPQQRDGYLTSVAQDPAFQPYQAPPTNQTPVQQNFVQQNFVPPNFQLGPGTASLNQPPQFEAQYPAPSPTSSFGGSQQQLPAATVPQQSSDPSRDLNTQQPAVQVESAEPMMEGYCMVALVDDFQWKLGKPGIGAMHLGRLYLFSSHEAREKFILEPIRYAPVMNGLDVVKFFDEGQVVQGVRAKGCTTENPNHLFFFSSEETLSKFDMSEQSRAYYTQLATELTKRAAADANRLSNR